jgi:hypothetical protein
MILEAATPKQLIAYLQVNPTPTQQETGEILLNLCRRLEIQESQNTRQDVAIGGTQHSLGQLVKRQQKRRMYAARRRYAAQVPPANSAE